MLASSPMCGGVKFIIYDEEEGRELVIRVYFPQPFAKIPVLEQGKTCVRRWGRREGEDENPYIPQTGWARLSNIESSYWQQFNPQRVLIPALAFAEKGKLPKSRWFPLPSGVFVMGLQVLQPDQPYIYVVTNPAAYGLEEVHPRMPHLVHEDFSPATEDFKACLEKEQSAAYEEPQQQKLLLS